MWSVKLFNLRAELEEIMLIVSEQEVFPHLVSRLEILFFTQTIAGNQPAQFFCCFFCPLQPAGGHLGSWLLIATRGSKASFCFFPKNPRRPEIADNAKLLYWNPQWMMSNLKKCKVGSLSFKVSDFSCC